VEQAAVELVELVEALLVCQVLLTQAAAAALVAIATLYPFRHLAQADRE
jgi:hypothetical protein